MLSAYSRVHQADVQHIDDIARSSRVNIEHRRRNQLVSILSLVSSLTGSEWQ